MSLSVKAIFAELNIIASSYENIPLNIDNAAVSTIRNASGITKILHKIYFKRISK